MLSPEKIERINELARIKKEKGLSEAEKKEQLELREEYLNAFRLGMRHHIEGMKIVDPEGNDVTPDKLKEIQKKKGLHNRENNF
ncbi:DUF896 family protein [Enterococcus durans]|uniref:UPF0291 protein CRM96_06135 n=2 Tax=Enterococcus durans TaxID=53345 RepID=A0A377L308_9ENTE|nr:DUF896 family protein [Enterococcus durans]HCB28657.1 DUF896 domain-containing protein [Enterococcus sp.]EOT35405.1 hypothetical protein OMS_00609 [Enterococcus durans ATCC 6056]EOU19358.1 hypothetical protein I571_02360 [Enterococcus durans ATCC 6056]MDB1685535.1 DUF896 family protein [Enterococcus durans]PEH44609.1 hypothetical protein CRM96_06135 [Enterococcus durans]